jgi:hypothetical protein
VSAEVMLERVWRVVVETGIQTSCRERRVILEVNRGCYEDL